MNYNNHLKNLRADYGTEFFEKQKETVPPMNVIVEALFRYSKKDWRTGEEVQREKVQLTRRIPVKDDSNGWVWSHHEIKTSSGGYVVWWRKVE